MNKLLDWWDSLKDWWDNLSPKKDKERKVPDPTFMKRTKYGTLRPMTRRDFDKLDNL